MSCDKQVSRLHKVQHSLVTRVPRILLQRAEEIFPSVKESMVFCSFVHRKEFIVICQFSWPKEQNIL
jgi:hypothetical protein